MAYERTSETIKSLKIHDEKRLKGLSMAKMCSLCMNLGVPELHLITKSTKSQIKLNIQTIEIKRENSQANRSTLFYKDTQSQPKLFFK